MTPALTKMPASVYHSDPCPRPSLSSSVAAELVNRSPYHAWLAHPKLGGSKWEATDDMERGSILHELVLERSEEKLVVLPYKDFRTNDAKDARDDARNNGKIPILEHKLDSIRTFADATVKELARLGIELTGQSEMVAIWEEDGVLCRGMLDHVFVDRGVIIDLKFCLSAHPDACSKHVVSYGCDIQSAAYCSFLRQYRADLAGREKFLWAFVEDMGAGCRPAVTLAERDGTLRQLGESKWDRAKRLWADCLDRGTWPAYSEKTVRLEAPAWALKEEGQV